MRFLKKNNSGDPGRFHSGTGSRKKKTYGPRFDGKNLTLYPNGEIDIQDEINSHAMECDMNVILTRLANGDSSMLNPSSPVYADFHDLPSNFREVLDVALDSENMFNKLPLDVRKAFDNDYREWLYKAGSPEWRAVMGVDQSGVDQSGVDQSGVKGGE